MANEINRRAQYTPARRTSDVNASAVRQIMKLRGDTIIDRAKITAEVSSASFLAEQRMDAGFDLAEHMTQRSARLAERIREMGDDPDLHQLHSYIKAAGTEVTIGLMQGPAEPEVDTDGGRR
jgi:hypothetical protein